MSFVVTAEKDEKFVIRKTALNLSCQSQCWRLREFPAEKVSIMISRQQKQQQAGGGNIMSSVAVA